MDAKQLKKVLNFDYRDLVSNARKNARNNLKPYNLTWEYYDYIYGRTFTKQTSYLAMEYFNQIWLETGMLPSLSQLSSNIYCVYL